MNKLILEETSAFKFNSLDQTEAALNSGSITTLQKRKENKADNTTIKSAYIYHHLFHNSLTLYFS